MEDTSTEGPRFLKVADVPEGSVLVLTSGRTQTHPQYGQSVVAQVEGGKLARLSMKSGIVKGLQSGKLHFPIRVTTATVFGTKGTYRTFVLAPKLPA